MVGPQDALVGEVGTLQVVPLWQELHWVSPVGVPRAALLEQKEEVVGLHIQAG